MFNNFLFIYFFFAEGNHDIALQFFLASLLSTKAIQKENSVVVLVFTPT